MEILYEGIKGSEPVMWVVWMLWGLGLICLMSAITAFCFKEVKLGIYMLIVVLAAGVVGYANSVDTRYPIVKATINETVSWKEVNKKV